MANDPIEILEAGGIPVSTFPESVRDVLAELSEDEANALVSVQRKVEEAATEVAGFAYFQQPLQGGQFTQPMPLRSGLNIGVQKPGLPGTGGGLGETSDPLADKGGVFW
jgi:hypothetical protein